MLHPEVATALANAETKKMDVIKKKCGNNRTPVANPPFCCRVGTGNSCMIAADRDDCTTNLGGTVQENKTCDAGSCARMSPKTRSRSGPGLLSVDGRSATRRGV